MADRSSQWEIILYPDSRPDFWEDVIFDSCIPCCLSPLHNRDYYDDYDEFKAKKKLETESDPSEIERLKGIKSGVLKKPHHHLIVDYGTGANKTVQQVQNDLIIPLNALKYPLNITTIRGRVRYTVHMDHPKKAQYSLDDIKLYNNFQVKDFLDLSSADVDEIGLNVLQYITEFGFHDYYQLEIACRGWKPFHKYVVSHSILLNTLFSSSGIKNIQLRKDIESNAEKFQDDCYIFATERLRKKHLKTVNTIKNVD